MDAREKLEFILYQMRIMIKKKDFIRLLIVSRKIGKKSFLDPEVEDLKIMFSTYMYTLLIHDKEYLNIARHVNTILETLALGTKCLARLPEKTEFGFGFERKSLVSHMVFFAAQAPYSDERSAFLKIIQTKYREDLDTYPRLKQLVKGLLGKELIACECRTFGFEEFSTFEASDEQKAEHAKALRCTLVQHNIKVISLYYSRVHLSRCSSLF